MEGFWIYFWAAVAVLLIILLAGAIRFEILFSRKGEDDQLLVKVRAFYGLLHFKYEIPVMYWNNLKKGLTLKKETVNLNRQTLHNEEIGKINRHTIIEKFEQFKEMLTHAAGLHKWMLATMKRVKCTMLKWETKIGLGDAADTAITTGMIWGIKSSLIGYIFNHVRLIHTPQLSVVPLFNEEHFETSFHCKLQIRIFIAILAGFYLLLRIMRVKGGLRVWRNILTRA